MLPFSRHFALMTIEGLGKKFQEARRARNLTLDEAARMTKIRPARLAEIEADDFSQFPSLAYAKGFLLIYGKFLDVDVTPYLDAFEDSERVTVDGYSYLQENQSPKPVTREDLAKTQETSNSSAAESGEPNRVAIRPLKRTYVRVIVGDEKGKPAFERWVSPTDGPVEFRGKHVSIRVLDPDAVKITKNGKELGEDDENVTIN